MCLSKYSYIGRVHVVVQSLAAMHQPHTQRGVTTATKARAWSTAAVSSLPLSVRLYADCVAARLSGLPLIFDRRACL